MFHGGSDITDPFMKALYPVGAVEIFPDAEGVCETSSTFKGLEAVDLKSGKWLMWPWPAGMWRNMDQSCFCWKQEGA